MSVDLKRQASDLYRQRDELGNIRTSDPLSLKRIVYASLGIVILALIAVQIFGGFSRRRDPIAAATAPPQVIKEAPPPELLQEPAAHPLSDTPAASETVRTPPQRTAAPEPAVPAMAKAEPAPAPAAPPAVPAVVTAQPRGGSAPSNVSRPEGRPQPKQGPRLVRDAKPAGAASSRPAKRDVDAKAPAPAPQPATSELEQTRRQLARDIVLESNSAISTLVSGSQNRGWKADPIGADEYNVVFSIMDTATGTPIQYIWKVNLSTRAVTPLSYYARKLS
jgi:type IV secretory pathway VirB10-like protein